MPRFPIRGASTRKSIRGFVAAANRGVPPNVKRWRREAIKAARAAALEDRIDAADGTGTIHGGHDRDAGDRTGAT